MTGVARGFRGTSALAATGRLCALACAATVAVVSGVGQSGLSEPSRSVRVASGIVAEGAQRCRGAGWPYASCGRDAWEPARRVRVIAIGASADARPR